ncbi:BglG family transcription antiterminator [Clostridium sp. Ade.TY]|uniref:BglG family transcription antiterminator n=1 Tax=Clostridium sp. Ade.TY TaxID=1391647 RepID=UPI00040E018D|nr:BglG family transcription antiterminator [Clostridium sp. Ade.TY]
MITLNKRQKDILKFLELKKTYTKLDEIAKNFDVSPRTVRNDLSAIEELLVNSEVTLERKPRLGIRLILNEDQYVEKLIEKIDYNVYSSDERITIIILLLIIKGRVTIEELANDVGVSKNTLVQDFRQVVDKLKEYDINVLKKVYHGITINDNEEKIRNVFFSIFSKLNNELKSDIKSRIEEYIQIESSVIKSKLTEIEVDIGTLYSEESFEELEMIILLSTIRYKNGFKVQYKYEDKKYLLERREFNILKEILHMEEDEMCYLLKIIDGLRRTIGGEVDNITKEILDELCSVLKIDCRNDLEFTSQISMHLKVAIHRIKNNLVIENPMLEEIKYKMSFIYRITEDILSKKENIIGVKFPEEEIAYMAMYFDAIFERNIKSNFTYRILIVCNGGLATSSLLKARINAMLPEVEISSICRMRDLDNVLKSQEIDFIVSTIPIKVDDYKVIKVNPILDSTDAEKIKNEIYNKRYEKNCKYLIDAVKGKSKADIEKLFPEKFTKFNLEINDWKEAIEVAAEPLLKEKKINKNYTTEIINVVETLGNYMVFIPKIAFVHATPDNVLENSMSLLTLKSELKFGSNNKVPVKAIVVLANKNQNMNLVNLINILTKDDNIEKFKNCNSYDEFKNII